MITCNDCITRFKSWGDDPRTKSGRYNRCGCDYCDKTQYYRDLEQPKLEVKTIVTSSSKDIDQLKASFLYLQRKLNNLDKKESTKERTNTNINRYIYNRVSLDDVD
jgi:hypothetical protein